MPKISQIDEVPCQAEVRNLQKITLKYYAQYPGVMQGSQEGKRAKLWGPRARFGANISMNIVYTSLPFTEKQPRKPETGIKDGFEETRPRVQFRLKRSVRKTKRTILMFL